MKTERTTIPISQIDGVLKSTIANIKELEDKLALLKRDLVTYLWVLGK